ncbi:DUF6504 family protein [Quadrisphaera sp. DSM 44207]|uniref:DUF6504 family protein n=1 Tax=Quadrisphaera sp. DSM 44207 TaxID=1881057 RepID=UPI000882CE3F|nr:DUF6504 family protein [Quadrisphaera sp. DSM 44207]SDQ78969.1 hypothetical protein SAMN05428996_2815 [Quadrisphaera sp. DSM 44207]
MGRRSGDVVHVRREPAGDGAPSAFVWRERLYVVREVLGHWHERAPWWEGAAALAVHGVEPSGGRPGRRTSDRADDGADDEVWRVAASAGQWAAVGTYDLGRPGGHDGWRLLRVVD